MSDFSLRTKIVYIGQCFYRNLIPVLVCLNIVVAFLLFPVLKLSGEFTRDVISLSSAMVGIAAPVLQGILSRLREKYGYYAGKKVKLDRDIFRLLKCAVPLILLALLLRAEVFGVCDANSQCSPLVNYMRILSLVGVFTVFIPFVIAILRVSLYSNPGYLVKEITEEIYSTDFTNIMGFKDIENSKDVEDFRETIIAARDVCVAEMNNNDENYVFEQVTMCFASTIVKIAKSDDLETSKEKQKSQQIEFAIVDHIVKQMISINKAVLNSGYNSRIASAMDSFILVIEEIVRDGHNMGRRSLSNSLVDTVLRGLLEFDDFCLNKIGGASGNALNNHETALMRTVELFSFATSSRHFSMSFRWVEKISRYLKNIMVLMLKYDQLKLFKKTIRETWRWQHNLSKFRSGSLLMIIDRFCDQTNKTRFDELWNEAKAIEGKVFFAYTQERFEEVLADLDKLEKDISKLQKTPELPEQIDGARVQIFETLIQEKLREIMFEICVYALSFKSYDFVRAIWDYSDSRKDYQEPVSIVPKRPIETIGLYLRLPVIQRLDYNHSLDGLEWSHSSYYVLSLLRSYQFSEINFGNKDFTSRVRRILENTEIECLAHINYLHDQLVAQTEELKSSKELLERLGFDSSKAESKLNSIRDEFLKWLNIHVENEISRRSETDELDDSLMDELCRTIGDTFKEASVSSFLLKNGASSKLGESPTFFPEEKLEIERKYLVSERASEPYFYPLARQFSEKLARKEISELVEVIEKKTGENQYTLEQIESLVANENTDSKYVVLFISSFPRYPKVIEKRIHCDDQNCLMKIGNCEISITRFLCDSDKSILYLIPASKVSIIRRKTYSEPTRKRFGDLSFDIRDPIPGNKYSVKEYEVTDDSERVEVSILIRLGIDFKLAEDAKVNKIVVSNSADEHDLL